MSSEEQAFESEEKQKEYFESLYAPYQNLTGEQVYDLIYETRQEARDQHEAYAAMVKFQIQAETQRADKAEEMVAGFKQGGVKDVINIYESRIKELQLRIHQEQTKLEDLKAGQLENGFWMVNDATLQDSRQKLCDEIVGKIEASYSNAGPGRFGGKVVGYGQAIDIVKSVLIDEE